MNTRVRPMPVTVAVAAILLLAWIAYHAPVTRPIISKVRGQKTVNDRLTEYGPLARQRLEPAFRAAKVEYPPARVVLAAIKKERILEIYASSTGGQMRYVKSYPIVGASGKLGPKLMEGDGQVPEGVYPITFLNPNSSFHLSLRVGYPNAFDRAMAKKDGRENLGQDIMIHGGSASIGCLAMGDTAAEDLFVLAADAGIGNIKTVISPVDFRSNRLRMRTDSLPPWTNDLYSTIKRELAELPVSDRLRQMQ